MENLTFISSILFIHVLAWLTPGPLFVLIISNSLVYSRRTGLWTALGFALGNLVHIALAVFGISLIIQSSSLIFNLTKAAGAVYLIYLGVKTILIKLETQKNSDLFNRQKDISPFSAVKTGFTANILSTGAYFFFASIFATILSAKVSYWVVVFLFIAMPLNTLFMSSILSLFFTQKKVITVYTRFQNIINKILGIALITLAIFSIFK